MSNDILKLYDKGSMSVSASMELLANLEQIIFNLTQENIELSVDQIIKLYDLSFPYSYNLIICYLIYSAFYSQKEVNILYLNFLKIIQTKEEEIIKNNINIISIFGGYIRKIYCQDSYYLIDKMIELKLTDRNIIENIKSNFFAHYKKHTQHTRNTLFDISEELSKNDFELHKQYIKGGHNPNEIAKIIRNDEIEKLQEISSQTNFNINQRIEPSLYERCSFINKPNVTLIDYAAFFSSVKCFKYLLMNGANVINTGKYAVAGGNEEIIHLCEQNHSVFEDVYETAIQFHRNDIFRYFYGNILDKLTIDQLNTCDPQGIVDDAYFPSDDINNNLGYLCIQNGNYEILIFLLENSIRVNEFLINNTAKFGNLFLIKHFLENNQISKNSLIYAMESKNIELIKYFIKQKGIDINAKDKFRRTVLMNASEKCYTEIVKLLLEQEGIDINAKDWDGSTALIITSKKCYTEIVKLLLEQEGIDINAKDYDGSTALIYASENGHSEIVKLLLEQEGIDVNAKDKFGSTALIITSKKGLIEIVKLLLEQEGIDVNAKDKDGKTALIYAYKNGHMEIVKLLLKQKGIDVNVEDIGRTALIYASENGHSEIVKLLLEQEGIDVNAKDKFEKTALIHASEKGHAETVQMLLKQKGIDVNTKDIFGKTALIHASEKGHAETVQMLLKQKGIDINAKDRNENTALIFASENGYTEIIKILLDQKGININVKDKEKTALIYASENGHLKIVQMLLDRGIDVNAKGYFGSTALIIASEKGHIEIVKLLLEQEGIDINTKDYHGKSALMYASSKGYTEIVKILANKK